MAAGDEVSRREGEAMLDRTGHRISMGKGKLAAGTQGFPGKFKREANILWWVAQARIRCSTWHRFCQVIYLKVSHSLLVIIDCNHRLGYDCWIYDIRSGTQTWQQANSEFRHDYRFCSHVWLAKDPEFCWLNPCVWWVDHHFWLAPDARPMTHMTHHTTHGSMEQGGSEVWDQATWQKLRWWKPGM